MPIWVRWSTLFAALAAGIGVFLADHGDTQPLLIAALAYAAAGLTPSSWWPWRWRQALSTPEGFAVAVVVGGLLGYRLTIHADAGAALLLPVTGFLLLVRPAADLGNAVLAGGLYMSRQRSLLAYATALPLVLWALGFGDGLGHGGVAVARLGLVAALLATFRSPVGERRGPEWPRALLLLGHVAMSAALVMSVGGGDPSVTAILAAAVWGIRRFRQEIAPLGASVSALATLARARPLRWTLLTLGLVPVTLWAWMDPASWPPGATRGATLAVFALFPLFALSLGPALGQLSLAATNLVGLVGIGVLFVGADALHADLLFLPLAALTLTLAMAVVARGSRRVAGTVGGTGGIRQFTGRSIVFPDEPPAHSLAPRPTSSKPTSPAGITLAVARSMATSPAAIGLFAILGGGTILGAVFVPTNPFGLPWGFSGWSLHLAALMDHGRLYENGAHTPMSPFPFVFMRAVTGMVWWGGDAVGQWHEQLWCHVFRVATVAILYLAAIRAWSPWAALGAAVAALMAFRVMDKDTLYDPLAQTVMAAVMVLTVTWVHAWRRERTAIPLSSSALAGTMVARQGHPHPGPFSPPWGPAGSPSRRLAFALGALLAVLALTKQSIAVGAGIALGLGLLGHFAGFFGKASSTDRAAWRLDIGEHGLSGEPWRQVLSLGERRDVLRYATLMLLGTVVGGGFLLVLLSAWVSPTGYLVDALLTGSQPKGGGVLMIERLLAVGGSVVLHIGGMALFIAAFRGGGYDITRPAQPIPWGLLAAIAMVGPTLRGLGDAIFDPNIVYTSRTPWMRPLWDAAAFGLARLFVFPADMEERAWRWGALVGVGGLIGQGLSLAAFRPVEDMNPVIMLGFLAVLAPLAPSWGLSSQVVPPPIQGGGLAARGFMLSTAMIVGMAGWALTPAWEARRDCQDPYPDIPALVGLRQCPSLAPLRTLASTVRTLAADPHATVLLLPEKPQMLRWFQRPRPHLSGAIVYADQYWDRLVDTDFATLRRHPPTVIVLAPAHTWKVYQPLQHPRQPLDEGFSALGELPVGVLAAAAQGEVDGPTTVGEGAPLDRGWGMERLIDRVRAELLPGRYELAARLPLYLPGRSGVDEAEVWRWKARLTP